MLPSGARAETTLADLAKEIAALKADNRQMRAKLSDLAADNHVIHRKIRRTADAPMARPYDPATAPVATTPAHVTAGKKLLFGGITITPGGFLAAESYFRSRTAQSDIGTSFGAIPTLNSPLAGTNEWRPTGRQSRVALLAEGAVTPATLLSGYIELDFLSAAQTANAVEANGYSPRIRSLYATLDNTDFGLHMLAGQAWSLATLNSKGITPRNEVPPPTIEAQYVPGFVWKRQAQIRLTKDFDRKLWLSLSAEESQTTFANACGTATTGGGLGFAATGSVGLAGINSITCGAAGTGGNFSGLTNYSINHVPDVIGKIAYEARAGDRDIHLEALGLYRDLYDRVTYTTGTSGNKDTAGYGLGAGVIVPIVPQKLDFQLSGLYGRGIGSYGTTTLPDSTINQDGSLRPIKEATALAGLTYHATPSIDVYAFGGFEKQFRSYVAQTTAGAFYGVGSPATNDTGCGVPNSALCNGANQAFYQITGGFWDKIYKGSFGEARVGLQYSYTQRDLFNAPGLATHSTNEQMVLTSFRYYPFQ